MDVLCMGELLIDSCGAGKRRDIGDASGFVKAAGGQPLVSQWQRLGSA